MVCFLGLVTVAIVTGVFERILLLSDHLYEPSADLYGVSAVAYTPVNSPRVSDHTLFLVGKQSLMLDDA